MNSVEARTQQPEQFAVATGNEAVEELSPLSETARKFLDELRAKLDPANGYVIRHPGGYETGGSGLSESLPALSLNRALKDLEWIFQKRAFTTRKQCRQYRLEVPKNELLGVHPCFVREIDGTVHEI